MREIVSVLRETEVVRNVPSTYCWLAGWLAGAGSRLVVEAFPNSEVSDGL